MSQSALAFALPEPLAVAHGDAQSSVILVVDDERDVRCALAMCLAPLPVRIVEAATACEAVEATHAERPDLIVLDLGLPDGSGLDVCIEVRRFTTAPILVLSARHAEAEKVALLNAGADDYVSKPFSVRELVARVEAHLRRSRDLRAEAAVIECDGLTVDIPNRYVRRAGRGIPLTPTEWSVLQTLARNPGRSLTHQQIFDSVWSQPFGNPQQYLRVFVTHLRRKIERSPANPRIIITDPGVGYRFGES
jgi:two-component system, OmpR family, KDP operon response regulator KdpE